MGSISNASDFSYLGKRISIKSIGVCMAYHVLEVL